MKNHRRAVGLLLLSVALAPGLAGAEEAKSDNHGYFGVGLLLESNNASTPAGDFSSTGGGLVINGAGIVDLGGPLGLGLTGGFGFAGRTDTDSDVSISEGQFGFDAGIVVADIFYASLGLNLLNQTPDDTDVMVSYATVPLGLGVLIGSDTGYMLGQLRFGAGEASNDQNNVTADLTFVGIRLVGQTGTANGLQFMGGLEFDAYDLTDLDTTDNYFRFFFGAGFGG